MGCISSRQPGVEDIRDKYTLGAILGSGTFGQVHRAVLKETGEERAVKIFERDDQNEKTRDFSKIASFRREVDTLRSLNHENIIIFFDFYEDPEFMYVVMELCTGGELFERLIQLRRFKEVDASFLARQMLHAIEYIHSRQVVHRDIKAENFIFYGDDIKSPLKMIDFGMACVINQGTYLTNLCGSPHYLAPELIGQRYTESVDLWSYGVLIYLILYGKYPFDAQDRKSLLVQIIKCKVEWVGKIAKPSNEALDHMKQLLTRDVSSRMTASQALYHRWIVSWATAKPEDAEKAPEINQEIMRNGHRCSTAFRTQIDAAAAKLRVEKLQKIDDYYKRGQKVGNKVEMDTQLRKMEDQPEFLRRDNKLSTTPMVRRPSFLETAMANFSRPNEPRLSLQPNAKVVPTGPLAPLPPLKNTLMINNKAITSIEQTKPAAPLQGKTPVSVGRAGGGRMSYAVGAGDNMMTPDEEKKLADMFDQLEAIEDEEEEDDESSEAESEEKEEN